MNHSKINTRSKCTRQLSVGRIALKKFRGCIALFFISSACLSLFASAQAQSSNDQFKSTDFPYQAIVAHDEVLTYSGPDQVHYATDELNQGALVTVYRHDPNGWCAIQPTDGSFSLVPEEALEKDSDHTGTIVQDNVQAWVGTRLGSVDKPLWQIKLRKDEVVEILGEASWPSPDGHSTVWYQIAPPAGEFRWVKMADLQLPNPASRSMPESDAVPNQRRMAQAAFTDADPMEDSYVQATAATTPAAQADSNFKKPTRGFVYRSEAPAADRFAPPVPPQPTNKKSIASITKQSDGPTKKPSATKNKLAQRPSAPQRANAPQPDTAGLDFKFRPIGKTARAKTAAAAIQSQEIPQNRFAMEAKSDADSEVRQVAFQDDRTQSPQSPRARGWQAASSRLSAENNILTARQGEPNITRLADRGEIRSRLDARQQSPWQQDATNNPARDKFADPVEFEWDDEPANSRSRDRSRFLQTGGLSRSTEIPDLDFSRSHEDATATGSALYDRLTPRLAQLEMELTNEMLKRPNEWRLSNLEMSVEQIYSQTQNPVERLQSQRMLDKLSNCKKIRGGYAKSFEATGETFGTSLSADSRRSRLSPSGDGGLEVARRRLGSFDGLGSYDGSTSGISTPVGSGVNHDFETNAMYDAHGWLTELVTEDRNNQPVYVLVNDEGKITHHVAASPGLNLNRYLKSKVGVNGRQGFNNVLKLDHVTADSVSELVRR